MICECHSLDDTRALGRRLGRVLRPGHVIALVGPLGSGKTTLVRAIAEGAGVADLRQVNSPTFVIVNEYDAPAARLFHIDTYRLRGSSDLESLGFDEMLARGAVLIEWADRVADLLPPDRLTLNIEPTGDSDRRFTATAGGGAADLLAAVAV